jgi:hypothetical protein
LILFLFAMPLWAQDYPEYSEVGAGDLFTVFDMEEEEEELAPIKEKFRFKNRTVELSVANFGFDFTNDFITAADFFNSPFYLLRNIKDIIDDPVLVYKDPVKINLNNFFDGFNFNFGTHIKPLSLNFNRKDIWGFGLDIAHIKVEGNLSLAENILSFSKAGQNKFGAGGAVFVELGIPVFFHANEFKVKIRPSAYIPLVYTEPKISYVGREGTKQKYNYNMRVYSLVDMEGLMDDGIDPVVKDLQNDYQGILKNNMGYDFGLSLEYPWDRWLDLGVDIVHIPVPFATASLNHYMQIKGSASVDIEEIDINAVMNNDDYINDIYSYELGDLVTGFDSSGKKIYRPFKMLFYANYRPLRSQTLSLIPSLGFSINHLYMKPASMEGGLSARFDFANIFIATLGINHNDHKWKNSVDLALNLRAFELDLGLVVEGITLKQSWQVPGLGANFGIKLGW